MCCLLFLTVRAREWLVWLLGRLASLSRTRCYSLSLLSDPSIQALKPELRGTAQDREEVGDVGTLQLR